RHADREREEKRQRGELHRVEESARELRRDRRARGVRAAEVSTRRVREEGRELHCERLVEGVLAADLRNALFGGVVAEHQARGLLRSSPRCPGGRCAGTRTAPCRSTRALALNRGRWTAIPAARAGTGPSGSGRSRWARRS